MRQNGTLIINTIRPYDTADEYPSAMANEVKGGHYQVQNLTDMTSIPAARRQEGMLCWVVAESKMYRLTGGIDNANWIATPYVIGDGVKKITVGATEPVAPSVGDLWVDMS